MTKLIWNALKHTPSVFTAAALLMAGSAIAQEVRPMPLGDADSLDQVTSVNQLSDVQPTDWAFQALQSLVERYGCIAGYPDGTYKGNRAMTRYEFAAGMNACLDRITEIIAGTGELVTKEDLEVLQRLQEEFAAELAALRGRVDGLEARTAELEANQFSTTTKLQGETLLMVSDTFGDGVVDDDDTQTTLASRVRLDFLTSFYGKDRLRARLDFNNIPNYSDSDLTNTLMSRLGSDGDTGGNVVLGKLAYRFPVGSKGEVELGATGYGLDDFTDPISPFSSSGGGALSRFGRFNPTFFRAPSNAGANFRYAFSDAFTLALGYAAGDAANPNDNAGLFNGSYSAFGQFQFDFNRLAVNIGYARSYHPNGDLNLTGSTGSKNARRPFNGGDQVATNADNLNFEVQLKIADGFQIGGWYGISFAKEAKGSDDATIINGAITLAFPDLFKEGSLGGIVVGVPPLVTSGDGVNDDDDTSLHIEAFYRFQMNDNIAITPGLFVITNADHNDNNDTIWVGALRTQFRF
ncbi:iron uptake porin [Okeania sp.]|uniref:iron uptake porin n=1 Tax=Okeania sp. TaxID=3100323 RepID=UPI002B4B778F|nr:iron uptake porin [Okeania sp.]MEB3341374.1 iron uptake porin [Okeania sp.]